MNTTDYDSMYPYTGGNQYSTKFWKNFVYVITHKYADFNGRASRGELWRYALVQSLIIYILFPLMILLTMLIFSDEDWVELSGIISVVLWVIIYIVFFLPNLALAARRLHDIDKSGWWLLIGIIPLLGSLYLLYCNVRRSDPQANRFGPNPIPEEYPCTGGNRYSTKFWKNFVYVTTHKYADFNGRASRGEFWRYTLVVFLISWIPSILTMIVFGQEAGSALLDIVFIVLLLPSLGVAVRRLHDIDKSGCWILIQLIPVLGWLYLLYCNVRRGDSQANRFGPNPIPEE